MLAAHFEALAPILCGPAGTVVSAAGLDVTAQCSRETLWHYYWHTLSAPVVGMGDDYSWGYLAQLEPGKAFLRRCYGP